MALTTTAVSTATEYIFTVTDGTEENFIYKWGKEPPEGQTVQEYLQSCKCESELLAQYEIDKKAPPEEIVFYPTNEGAIVG